MLILSMMEWWSVETQQRLSLLDLAILKHYNVTWIGKDLNLVRLIESLSLYTIIITLC